MKKTFILIISVWCICYLAQSQNESHVFQFNIGVGQESPTFRLSQDIIDHNGSVKNGVGHRFDAWYTYYFLPWMGFSTGLHYSNMNALVKADLVRHAYNTVDDDTPPSNYIFNVELSDLSERVSIYSLGIPIQLQLRVPFSETVGMQIGIGVKAQYAISLDYRSRAATLKTSGYYPDMNAWIEDVPSHGFYTLTDVNLSHRKSMGFLFSATGDLGFYFEFMRGCDLYVGAYYDFALNPYMGMSVNPKNQELYTPYNGMDQSPSDLYNGIFSSSLASDLSWKALGAKVGIRVRF